jgi:hypothetical protein
MIGGDSGREGVLAGIGRWELVDGENVTLPEIFLKSLSLIEPSAKNPFAGSPTVMAAPSRFCGGPTPDGLLNKYTLRM